MKNIVIRVRVTSLKREPMTLTIFDNHNLINTPPYTAHIMRNCHIISMRYHIGPFILFTERVLVLLIKMVFCSCPSDIVYFFLQYMCILMTQNAHNFLVKYLQKVSCGNDIKLCITITGIVTELLEFSR